MRHSVVIKVLTVVMAAFLLVTATVQERHVHPGSTGSADCSICYAAHSPATVATVSQAAITVTATLAAETVFVPFISAAAASEHFIRPPPAVL